MKRRRFFWQVYPTFLTITLLFLVLIILYVSYSLREFYFEQVSDELSNKARLLEHEISRESILNDTEEIQKLCASLGIWTDMRITVILPDGKVIADSDENPGKMVNHADRPEIKEAFKGSEGKSIRFSSTLKQRFMYVAIPIKSIDKAIEGVVRTSLPLTSVERQLKTLYKQIITSLLVIALLSGFVFYKLSRKISDPLEKIKTFAESIAKREGNIQLPKYRTEEIESLSKSIEMMAHELEKRINTAEEQRSQIEAVFLNMEEGVVAVDSDERILTVNQAASRYLDIDISNSIGKRVAELVRIPKLQKFIKEVLIQDMPKECQLVLHCEREITLKAYGAKFPYNREGEIGALIVLNDVTKIKHLERIRKDFVANVSHELKTPITSIKGFVETLLDSALNNHDDQKRFLEIILKHTNRLDAIIDDLLILSRLEEDDTKQAMEYSEESLINIIKSAVEICCPKAKEKEITINLNCPQKMKVKLYAPLIEQAVINLIDNAIKFSDVGSNIDVDVNTMNSETIISVKDYGCGISEKHFSRLTERFYRVDKSRSSKMGGTGLGLAIVKHIVQLHDGRLEVDSKLGKGSTFSIHLKA